MSNFNINQTGFEKSEFSNSTIIKETDQKTYSLGRKIIEGIALVFLNIVTVFFVNFELLRGDRSFLLKEYQAVFSGRKVRIIKPTEKHSIETSPFPNQPQNKNPENPKNSSTLNVAQPSNITYRSISLPLNHSLDQIPVDIRPSIQFPDGELTLVGLTTTFKGVNPDDPVFETLIGNQPVYQIEDLTQERELPIVYNGPVRKVRAIWDKADSLITQTRNMIFGTLEESELEVDAKFHYRVGDIDLLFRVVVNMPVEKIQEGIDPGSLVMNQALQILNGPELLLQNGYDVSVPLTALTVVKNEEIPNIVSPAIIKEFNERRNPSLRASIQTVASDASNSSGFNPLALGIAGVIVMLSYEKFINENNPTENLVLDNLNIGQIPSDEGEQSLWGWVCTKTKNFANSVIQKAGSIPTAVGSPTLQTNFFQEGGIRTRFELQNIERANPDDFFFT